MTEDRYLLPENILEIEVCDPKTIEKDGVKFTEYLLLCKVTISP